MGAITNTIFDVGLVPLIVLEDARDAVPFAKALVAGGVPIAEVTFRTDAARQVIAAMAREVPEILVGAGTVHTVEQAREAVEAGAKFIVTPGFNPQVIRWCQEKNIEVIPGTVSPADLEQALELGLLNCKFFPAAAYGGVNTLKALSGPYAQIQFMPTGGVTEENMLDYLSLKNVGAVGGSFMAPSNLVKEKKWDEISALCRQMVQKVLGFRLLHVGINTGDEDEAATVANTFGTIFGQPVTEQPKAFFAGEMVEVVKGPSLGAKGHIAVGTRDIVRAVSYLERRGVALDESTALYDAKGRLTLIYLREEIGGFAVHLRQL